MRQMKNFLALTLFSLGTPMILMGDEVCRTQAGNNNAYGQDNEIRWFDWRLPGAHPEMHRFVRQLIHILLNAYWEPLEFELPPVSAGNRGPWHRWVDTFRPSPEDVCTWGDAPVVESPFYSVQPRTVVVLFALHA